MTPISSSTARENAFHGLELERAARRDVQHYRPSSPIIPPAMSSLTRAMRTRSRERQATVDQSTSTLTNECECDRSALRLIVMDFDLTILRTHSFATRVAVDDLLSGARDAANDFVDLVYFKQFISASSSRERWRKS